MVSKNDRRIETAIDPDALARIVAGARRVARDRLRTALDEPTAPSPALQTTSNVDHEQLDQIADEEAERASGPLLHVAVVHAVSQELGIEVQAALEHPAVDRARQLLEDNKAVSPADAAATTNVPWDTATPEAERGRTFTAGSGDGRSAAQPTRQRALLLDAVHVFGIETLEPGDRDLELRLAGVGIDVCKPSTAEVIGRLGWNEVRSVAVQRPRRGLPGRRRPALLVAGTDRGEVTFELPGVSDDAITEHLEPLIARNCVGCARAGPDAVQPVQPELAAASPLSSQ
jgi:hypothetical protein